MTIAAILASKGDQVFSISPDEDAAAIARTLARHRVGAVLVIDSDGAVVGIVSERDIVRAMARSEGNTARLSAKELMTRDLATVTRRTRVVDALGLMTDRRIRHLPVMEEGALLGMVSIGDLVKARLGAVEMEAESLRTYVQAGA